MSNLLIFLKLGGSLITEKDKISTPRLGVIARLAGEISAARKEDIDIRLVLGHGSGSFGHVPAKKYNTLIGVHTDEQWAGFLEVWQQAAALNRIVMDAFGAAHVPAIAFPPSASVSTQDRKIAAWDISPLKTALEANLVPIVYGDVVFDKERGGTILSTEDLFVYLAKQLRPKRILLAGDETGIFSDYPAKKHVVNEITPGTYAALAASLSGATGADVTGGMASKVQAMLDFIRDLPDVTVNIFSGIEAGNVQKAIHGAQLGTILRA